MLHAASPGFVELTPGTRPPGSKVQINRRDQPEHFLPEGAAGNPRWLARLLEHAQAILEGAYARRRFAEGPREERFVGVTSRTERSGDREHVSESDWLWIDIDEQDRLEGLYAFLAQRPCHMLVSSGGSRGVHCYWRLDRPLPAVHLDGRTGEVSESIERANLRLVNRLGADRACRDRARLLRVAGSPNHKRGEWARIVQADLALPAYRLAELVGDLPDEDRSWLRRPPMPAEHDDPYRRIPAAEYMVRLAGRKPNREGMVRCPAPGHADEHPSCSVTGPNPECWHCQSCGAAGGIYDLASIMLGGPYGRGRLGGEDFARARELVGTTFAGIEARALTSEIRRQP
jgi:hypothetical protein